MNDNPDPVNVIDSPATARQPEPPAPPAPTDLGTSRPGAFFGWLARSVPTALVLAALGGLAYWGHHTGWNFGVAEPRAQDSPRELAGGVVTVPDDPGATAHDWCPNHGVHDCPFEHPNLAQAAKPPTVTQEDLERARRALAVRPRPENDPIRPQRRLRFASAGAVEQAGIDIAPVWREAVTEVISASGEISFDPTRTARLTARVSGTARHVARKAGDPVRAGEVLALVDAREVGKAKSAFLEALVRVRLARKYLSNLEAAGPGIAKRQIQEAEAALRNAEATLLGAEQALINLGLPVKVADCANTSIEDLNRHLQSIGLPKALVRSLDPEAATANLLPVRAPFDGVVLASDVITGELVDTTKVLFVVLDPRRVWLTLHVGLEDVGCVAVGRTVKFRPDGLEEEFTGKLTWVGTGSDAKTRTVPVRAELANEAGRLRASTFGVGRIVLREEPDAMVVPAEAVQSDGGSQIVFVRHRDFLQPNGPKEFFVRAVRTGARQGPNTEIIAGVLPGEVVVTRGSRRLLNELKKSTAAGR